VVAVNIAPRRSPESPQRSGAQNKAPQNAPHRPVAEQTIPTTPKIPDGVVPQPPENAQPVENGGSAGAASEVVVTTMTGSGEPTPGNSPLSFHPIAEIFAVLDDDRLQMLANDIAQHGLLDEIVLYEGKILDGRCRYLASARVGVAPKFREYVGDDPLAFVIGRNIHRRHLTKTQSTFAAARAATLPVGANQNTPGLPIGRAAEIFQVSERNIARAKAILRRGAADLVQAVESGKVAISRAAELCELANEEQSVGVNEIAERKRNPQKKKASASALNQNTTVGQKDGASQPECSPSADGHDLDIPKFLDCRDPADRAFADLMAEWEKAPDFRRAWGNTPVAIRDKFYAEVMKDYRE
jgi:ParB-like chromosome segregation protein Spo0J